MLSTTQPYQCDVCHSRFTRHENLKRHALVHDQSTRQLACELCETTFSRSDLLHRHMRRKHPENVRAAQKRQQSKSSMMSQHTLDDDDDSDVEGSESTSMSNCSFTQPLATVWCSSSRGHTRRKQPQNSRNAIDRDALEEASTVDGNESAPSSLEHTLSADWRPGSLEQHSLSTMPSSISTTNSFRAYSFDRSTSPYAASSRNLEGVRSSLHILEGVELFFGCTWLPIIHRSTFDPDQAPEHLLLAMACIGHRDERLSYQCYHKALQAGGEDSLALVQTLLLLEIYSILYLGGRHTSTGFRLHQRIVTLVRSAGLLRPIPQQQGDDLHAVWLEFAKIESCKRTMLLLHQVDVLWYQLLSIPRSLSHLEIKHDLPCTDTDWEATTSSQWAYSQLTSAKRTMSYVEAIRSASLPPTTPFGLSSIIYFVLSSIREVSGWSTITGQVSMERVEPLKRLLLSLEPKCSNDALWRVAMIELHIWSLPHTGGSVHSGIESSLLHSTQIAAACDLIFSVEIIVAIKDHVDWFLRYLAASDADAGEAIWIPVCAYQVFLLTWQCLQGELRDILSVVNVVNGDVSGAVKWARGVFTRWQHREIGRIILRCLDLLEASKIQSDQAS